MALKIDLPDVENTQALTDWVEAMILLSAQSQLSRARLLDALAANVGLTRAELEVHVGHLFAEIDRRRRIAGRGYPLHTEESFIKLDTSSQVEVYKFFLLICLSDKKTRKSKRFREVDGIFDSVVMEAVKYYLGAGAEAKRFGWPPSDGRPKKFDDALEWLAECIGLSVGSGKPSKGTKDGGVDVIAWKHFADKSPAFTVVLVQSTVRTDWYPKSKDIVDYVWLSYITTGRPAVTGLAVPYVIPRNFDKWSDLRCKVNLVFDRLRLAQMLADIDTSSFGKVESWNKKELVKSKNSVGL